MRLTGHFREMKNTQNYAHILKWEGQNDCNGKKYIQNAPQASTRERSTLNA